MMFPPGVWLASLMAERKVTMPTGGKRMSAVLFTLKTVGTMRGLMDTTTALLVLPWKSASPL